MLPETSNRTSPGEKRSQNLDAWKRLEQIIDKNGLSINAFAAEIGLKRPENLYQIKRGNNGISVDLARKVCVAFPYVDRTWLLTGRNDIPVTSTGGDLTEILGNLLKSSVPLTGSAEIRSDTSRLELTITIRTEAGWPARIESLDQGPLSLRNEAE